MLLCPQKDCHLCQRLVDFRKSNRVKFPMYHNNPVEAFGSLESELLIVGLAPGLHGANQTNRPFTNDYAGDILYPALLKYGLAKGNYRKRKDDGFELIKTRVTNCVRCVPPQNKVIASEIANCREFLQSELASMPNIKLILCLGSVAHGAVLKALGYTKTAFKFSHGAKYFLAAHNLVLFDSYHTSRYNINTNVLTAEMFDALIAHIAEIINQNRL